MVSASERIAWVRVEDPAYADGDLAIAYGAVADRHGRVENLYQAMSLTPRAIVPAHEHYLAVLHNTDSPLESWLAEFCGTFVAVLCGCSYAAENHGANFRMYLKDDALSDRWLSALRDNSWRSVLEGRVLAAAKYTEKLTTNPQAVTEADIQALRDHGFTDKGISYLIQIVASFAYWSRVINGLGIALGDEIGLAASPRQGRVGAPQRPSITGS